MDWKKLNEGAIRVEWKAQNKQQIRKQVCMLTMLGSFIITKVEPPVFYERCGYQWKNGNRKITLFQLLNCKGGEKKKEAELMG